MLPCNTGVSLSSSAAYIVIPADKVLDLIGEHMVYAAERASRLRRLIVEGPESIAAQGVELLGVVAEQPKVRARLDGHEVQFLVQEMTFASDGFPASILLIQTHPAARRMSDTFVLVLLERELPFRILASDIHVQQRIATTQTEHWVMGNELDKVARSAKTLLSGEE